MTKTTSHVVIGTTLVLAIFIAAWQLLDDRIMALWQPEAAVEQVAETPQSLLGTFLMTMRPMKPEASTAIYRMLAGSGELKMEYDQGNFYAPSLSQDGKWMASVREEAGLTVSPVSEPETTTVFTPPSPALGAGASDWSSDDALIAYEAITALPSADETNMEYSRVVVLNPTTGEQSIVDGGASPIFAPDNSLLYLKADGVYRIKLDGVQATGTADRFIYFSDYVATRNSQIALSPAGDYLVVTHPDIAAFTAYTVYGNEHTVSVSPLDVKMQRVVWPVFSPDGARLAFINLTQNSEGITRKSLNVLEFATLKERTVAPLDSYEDVSMSIGAWLPAI